MFDKGRRVKIDSLFRANILCVLRDFRCDFCFDYCCLFVDELERGDENKKHG
jgi:hypothetical protein